MPTTSRVLLALLVTLAAPILAAPVVWEGDSVPPPEPVRGEVELGVYIFPGWYRYDGRGDYPYRTHDEDSEWRAVAKKPAPRPLLGFYDETMPEVNAWQISWALEHGITFFCFDWYWNAGEHRLMRTLERGFLKSKYCNMMKFCIHCATTVSTGMTASTTAPPMRTSRPIPWFRWPSTWRTTTSRWTTI